MMQIRETERGFLYAEWFDLYGGDCSIQESSLATQSALWLGKGKDRMHLSVEMVAELIPLLKFFVQSGALPTNAILEDGK